MYAKNKTYRTMRRNSRKYQPKHLRVDVVALRFRRRVILEAILIAITTFLASIAFILCINLSLEVREFNTTKQQPVVQNQITSISATLITGGPRVAYEEVVRVNSSYESVREPYDVVTTDYKIEPVEAELEIKQAKIIHPAEEPESDNVQDFIGNNTIELSNATLVRYDLPSKYYGNIDFSSFQPYMCYTAITNKSAPAYDVVNSERCYTDEYGLRRYTTTSDQFTIQGQDDYVIALGTYYKEKGLVGNRYLIVTTNGMYTAITGDEKSDNHTDDMHMFTMHSDGTCAGIIEWIVDYDNLNSTIARSGTVTRGGPDVLKGEILYIYGIE